jgi:hypothetical protein
MFLEDSTVFTEIIRNVKYILPIMAIPGNEEHFYAFIFKIDSIDLKNIPWRLSTEFLQSIRDNEYLFLNKDFNDKLTHLALKHVLADNFQLASESLRILVTCLKYSRKLEKENILRQVTKEIYSSGSFYKRRFAEVFFSECVEQLSVSFIVENRLYEMTIKMISDSPCIAIGLLREFQRVYPVLEQREKKQLASKLDAIRENKTDKDITYVRMLD